MSDIQTDIWYERANDLLNYANEQEREELKAFKANIEDFAEHIVLLEEKYSTEREKDHQRAVRELQSDMWPEPALTISSDGIYPRCVWCNGENYLPAVIAYSKGEIGCAAVNGCGKKLPKGYIKL